MGPVRTLLAALPNVMSRRHRQVFIALVVTCLTSALLLGLIALTRWRGRQALQSDTHTSIIQAGQELIRTLQSRRGTLTFIRDTINRSPDLSPPQLQAMGASGVQHTRHLVGLGLVRAGQLPEWWAGPGNLKPADITRINDAIRRRSMLRGVWLVPSTFVVPTRPSQAYLLMLEPLRARPYRQSGLIGIFNATTLVQDFFATSLLQRYPVQFLNDDQILYRSRNWQEPTDERHPIIVDHAFTVDAAHWTIQMQPGATRLAQTLSWFNVLLIVLSVIAGLGIIAIVWMLVARTYLLQQAVARRTAALRRTSERLREMASTDELTGLHNRRFFLERLTWECDRAKRYQRPLACLMVDVNGFKFVNDRLGHPTGDLILKQVSEELQRALRQSDILARFGGDEFVIALPETTIPQASLVAEKLRQMAIPVPGGNTAHVPPVTLSVGMSRADEQHSSPKELLEAADQSLYASKRRTKSAAAVHS